MKNLSGGQGTHDTKNMKFTTNEGMGLSEKLSLKFLCSDYIYFVIIHKKFVVINLRESKLVICHLSITLKYMPQKMDLHDKQILVNLIKNRIIFI